jgi:deazaflavin-dependent oxidoreductase (nitroreductase family)
MRTLLVLIGATAAALVAVIAWWRRHPRTGSAYVNRVVNPWLVRHRVADRTDGEIGLIEHVGRRSGVVRVSPVHPVPTEDGYRIVVPLGTASEWARNVLAAQRCRMQIGGTIHELDRPRLAAPTETGHLPRITARLLDGLGFRYLLLHRLEQHPGELEAGAAPLEAVAA